jgi:hypothetical protein
MEQGLIGAPRAAPAEGYDKVARTELKLALGRMAATVLSASGW